MGSAKREKLGQDFVFTCGDVDSKVLSSLFKIEPADPFTENEGIDPLDAYRRSGVDTLFGYSNEPAVRWLLQNQEYLFTLDELRAALADFRDYLQASESAIVQQGESPSDLLKAGWLFRHLAPLYPHDADILSSTERKMLRHSKRKELLELKLGVISALIEALDSKNADQVAELCDPILARAPQGDEAEAYLRVDRFYLGLGLRGSNWLNPSKVVHSGGLTDILELIWHVERELAFGTYAKVRQELGDDRVKIGKNGIPELTKKSPYALDGAARTIHSKFLFHSISEHQGIDHDRRWAVFLCWAHESLGLTVPGLKPSAIAYGKSEKFPLIFRTSAEAVKIITGQKFVPSYTYQKIVFNNEILTLTPGEGKIVKVLYEDEYLKQSAPDGWVKQDDVREALVEIDGPRGDLRDVLWTNRHKKMREALNKKLLSEEQRKGEWHYRLNV